MRTVTSTEYKQAIYAHSHRYTPSSSFPGRNYEALANWLLRSAAASPQISAKRGDGHKLIYIHQLGDARPDTSVRVVTDADADSGGAILFPPRPEDNHRRGGQVLFFCGFPSPTWVAELGSRYRIDPEFFQRHLDFLSVTVHGSSFDSPSLPNTSNNIIHIPVNTILRGIMSVSTINLYDSSVRHRAVVKEQLAKYRRGLQSVAACGDSIVREYSILSSRYSVIEQRISVCVAEDGDGWAGKFFLVSHHFVLVH